MLYLKDRIEVFSSSLLLPPYRRHLTAFLKSHLEIFVYFDCVQLAIGGRGHVTQHMRECTVHNQNKNNSRESETKTELSKLR